MENNNIQKDEEKELSSWKWWALSVLICLVIWIGGGFATHWYASNHFTVGDNDNAPALFGDSFGAVNALISAIAFAGMLVTFRLQKYELSLQRKELKEQRMEFNQQNATLKLQRFENTFFNMMELQQQIVSGLSLDYKGNKNKKFGNVVNQQEDESYVGREVFEGAYLSTGLHEGLCSTISRKGIEGYNESSTTTIFDHYFRNLYTILKFIDETKVFDEENLRDEGESVFDVKYRYATILRASLSRYELVMLYYNGLSDNGKDKLKPLLEKYSMLNNLNKYLLTLSKNAKDEINLPPDVKNVRDTFQKNNLSGTDYELLLCNSHNDSKKYHYSVFAHTEKEKRDFEGLITNLPSSIETVIVSFPRLTSEEKRRKEVFGHI